MARGNGAARRWALMFTVVAVLIALPVVIRVWPAADGDRSAADLRVAALASLTVPFSGYAESAGTLSLPETDQLGSVADLFSDRTTMRVWWRGPTDNRVDVLSAGGETDLYRDAAGTWTWEYEPDRVTRTDGEPLALPAPPDLLPPTLARRLLSEARPEELTRLPAERIAGRVALGLRLVPADAAASVARVDSWIDADTGLPLRVQIFDRTSDVPAIDTGFLDVDIAVPDTGTTSFSPPPGASQQTADPLGALNRVAGDVPPFTFPDTLAGLQRRTIDGAPAGIGLYGRGVTLLTVVPLPRRVTRELRDAADQDPTSVTDDSGTRLEVGPLGIMLIAGTGGTSYGLIGTVTAEALVQAATELSDLEGPR